MKNKTWLRAPVKRRTQLLLGFVCVLIVFALWFIVTSAPSPEDRIIPINTLANPIEILQAFPRLIMGSADCKTFYIERSLIFAISKSFLRELLAFLCVLLTAIPLGICMSASKKVNSFFTPLLTVGTFIPIAALVPLTQAFFGTDEFQKIVFLGLGMFFVLLGLVIKEMDEVDSIYLDTAYTLGFSPLKTLFLVNFPAALPRIYKHFSSVFGVGWGYIIFAEQLNTNGGNIVDGIGWMFISRIRRGQIADVYALLFVIILFAFFIRWFFKVTGRNLFKWENL